MVKQGLKIHAPLLATVSMYVSNTFINVLLFKRYNKKTTSISNPQCEFWHFSAGLKNQYAKSLKDSLFPCPGSEGSEEDEIKPIDPNEGKN